MRSLFFLWIALALGAPVPVAAATIPVPDPTQCSVEPVIVGNSSGALIGDGFRVTVRDATGATMAGSVVTVGMPSAVHPYTSQVGTTQVTCASHKIYNVTNGFGEVVFQPRVGGYANAPSVQVIADGFLLRTVVVRSTDIDADGATAVGDFNLFRLNFLFAPAAAETDYDESGATDVGDFNIFRRIFLNDVPGTPCP